MSSGNLQLKIEAHGTDQAPGGEGTALRERNRSASPGPLGRGLFRGSLELPEREKSGKLTGGAGAVAPRLILTMQKEVRIGPSGLGLEASEIERFARLDEPREASAAGLWAAGYWKEAGDVRECGTKFVHYTCRDCEGVWESLWRCGVRVCPGCARRRARRLFELHKDLCGRPNLKHLVLTVPNVDHLSREVINELRGAFTKLRRRKAFRGAWRGGVYSIEFTFSQATRWHVHVHVLIDGRYLPQPYIKRVWGEITGGRRDVWIGMASNPRQVLKYILAPGSDLWREPAALRELMEATRGVHLTCGFGIWYLVRGLSPRGELVCPFCGSRHISIEVVPSICGSERGPPLQELVAALAQLGSGSPSPLGDMVGSGSSAPVVTGGRHDRESGRLLERAAAGSTGPCIDDRFDRRCADAAWYTRLVGDRTYSDGSPGHRPGGAGRPPGEY